MNTYSSVNRLLGIDYPIVQGPFGGGLSTTELVATVSNAGGLGSYGAHMLEADELGVLCDEIRKLTQRPFAINLWVSDHDPEQLQLGEETFQRHLDALAPAYRELGVKMPGWTGRFESRFKRQVEALIRAKPKVFSFVFGIPSAEILQECKKQGIVTVGAATTLEEALAIEAAHVDAVVVTGFEAGGHRPSFLKPAEDSLHGTFALIPVVKDRVRIPIIAAGGIADLRGVNAALALGADAVQLGTAFLACAESGASSSHKAMLHSRGPMDTVLSRAFTGRLARFRENRAIREFESSALPALPFPAQSDLMAPLKRRAAELGNIDYQSLYASQTSALVRHRSAAALMDALKPAFSSSVSTTRKLQAVRHLAELPKSDMRG